MRQCRSSARNALPFFCMGTDAKPHDKPEDAIPFRLDRCHRTGGNTETPDVDASQPWTEIVMPWIATRDVHQVHVCIMRRQSEKFDNQIQGTAWIDDVTLVPENPKP